MGSHNSPAIFTSPYSHQHADRCALQINGLSFIHMWSVMIHNGVTVSLRRTTAISVGVLLQLAVVMAGIEESVRVEPAILKTLDSIAPNARLIFLAKRGQEIVLLGDDLNMSLYGLDESYTTQWSWTPKSSKIRYAGIAGVQMFEEGFGECLVGNRAVPRDVYRYSFVNGRTRDSTLLSLPKPANHIIENIDAKGRLVAFTALVQTLTSDTLFAYVVDTVSGWHSVWKVPVSADVSRINESAIRIVDTTVVVYWQEQVNVKDYRTRILVRGIHSQVELQSVILSDVGDHKYQARLIAVDDADTSIAILAQVTNRDEPRFGIQYWKLCVLSGELTSNSEFLPKHTYLSISDATITRSRDVIAVGSIIDVDPTTLQLIQSTSRGFLCQYDSVSTMKRLLSMQDQRPSSISSVFQDHDELLIVGQGVDRSHYIARIDEDRITSVSQSQVVDHKVLQHLGWYNISGQSLLRPDGGAVIELLQCSPGCFHSKLLWQQ